MSSRDLVVAAAGASAPSDPNFKNVSLLLSGDGTNGAQNNTFLDSSTNNFTITRNGNTTQGTFSPYGNLWSNYFDGSGDYLTLGGQTQFAFGTGDFTIETCIYPTTNNGVIYDCRPTSTNGIYPSLYIDNGTFGYHVNNAFQIYGGAATLNSWQHIAVVRSSGTTKMYLNGVQVGSNYTDTNNYIVGANRPVIGANGYATSNTNISCYISNLRVVKGTALYTSNFTPSTTPLTAISGTSLLTCQSNRFVDNSSNNFTLTVNGNTSVQRFSPFNPTAAYGAATIGGSGYFDGTGDYLNAGTNTAFAFGTGAFTMEAWIYDTGTTASYGMIVASNTYGSTNNVALYLNGSTKKVWYGSAVYLEASTALTPNSWNHVAAARNGTTVTLYLNGVSVGSATDNTNIASTVPMQIGASSNNNADSWFKGYISNARLVKGTAVYTSNFTPPTAPVTAITNTSLLCNFTNAGIPDAAMMNDLETVGNAQVSTSVKKYGTGSLAFDGTGDWLLMPSTPNMSLGSGDFTIEGWLYPGSQPGAFNAVVGSSATGGPILNLRGSGTSTSIGLNSYGSADIFNISYTFTQNTWVHVAVSRSGTSLKLFINGTQTGSTVTNSTNFSGYITSVGMADAGNQVYNGYIDDLRITKGYARYTANFTPPTAALPTY